MDIFIITIAIAHPEGLKPEQPGSGFIHFVIINDIVDKSPFDFFRCGHSLAIGLYVFVWTLYCDQ